MVFLLTIVGPLLAAALGATAAIVVGILVGDWVAVVVVRRARGRGLAYPKAVRRNVQGALEANRGFGEATRRNRESSPNAAAPCSKSRWRLP